MTELCGIKEALGEKAKSGVLENMQSQSAAFLQRPDNRIRFVYTPKHCSWLNQVEIWFNIFSRDVIRGGIWHSKKELIDQIMLYIRKYNGERAHPFKWTYTGKPLAA